MFDIVMMKSSSCAWLRCCSVLHDVLTFGSFIGLEELEKLLEAFREKFRRLAKPF